MTAPDLSPAALDALERDLQKAAMIEVMDKPATYGGYMSDNQLGVRAKEAVAALRQRLAEAERARDDETRDRMAADEVIARVWTALGISAYSQTQGMSISEIVELREKERNALRALAREAAEVTQAASDALTCGQAGDELESHYCGRCDCMVDRNREVRVRLDALLARLRATTEER